MYGFFIFSDIEKALFFFFFLILLLKEQEDEDCDEKKSTVGVFLCVFPARSQSSVVERATAQLILSSLRST